MKNYYNKIYRIKFASIDSTNLYLKNNYELMDKHKYIVVISDIQISGRGQRNNIWYSMDRGGLYFSFGTKMIVGNYIEYLPHLAGVSIIDCLYDISGSKDFKIKKPNDILYKGKKISGILIENIVKGEDIYLVIGIGINVNSNIKNFPDDLREIAGSLKEIYDRDFDKDDITDCLTDNLIKNLKYLINDKEMILKKYNNYLI